jgi:hypothetical protein
MSDLSSADRQEAYRRATERVRARIGLLVHAALFVVVTLLLLVINLISTPGAWWFFWPMLFWAIALVAHAAVIVGPGMRAVERWRDRELAREVELMRRTRSSPSTKEDPSA